MISFKLKITLGYGDQTKNPERSWSEIIKENSMALKKLFNLPALIFFGILFHGGALWGVHDTYLLIYLQNELGASSKLVSK